MPSCAPTLDGMNRALRVAWPALTILVALGAGIVATSVVSGGASALLVARAAVLVLLALSIAGVLGPVLAAVAEPDAVVRGRVLDVAATAAGVWTVAAAATAFLLYLGEAPAFDSPAFGPGLVAFLADIEIGRTWAVAAGLAAVLTALLVAVRGRRGVALLWGAGLVAAVPVALQSATSGDALSAERTVTSAGLVQLVAVGSWLGLVALRPARIVPVAGFAAVLIGVGAALPALAADGAVTPVAIAGACAIVLAGASAVIAALARVDLRAVQLPLLAAGVGLAVAGAATRTPPDVPARTSPAEILTGAPLPPAPTIGAVLGAWQPDAAWLVVAVGLLIAYVVAVRRADVRVHPVRTVSWIVGLVLLVWLTCGGPAVYRQVLVLPELAQQVALLLVVPLLLAGGAPLRLLAAAVPLQRLRVPVVGAVAALVIAVAVVALLNGTALLDGAVTGTVGTGVATVVLLGSGCLLVRALGAAPRRTGVVVVVVLLIVETAGAVLLGTSGTLLLAGWYGAMGWGTDALAAQRIAAVVVWPLAAVPTGVLLVHAVRSPRAAGPRLARPEVMAA